MTEFIRNKETGVLEVWKNSEKVGEIVTMGDEIESSKEIKPVEGKAH